MKSPCGSLATEVISVARRREEREGEKQRRRKKREKESAEERKLREKFPSRERGALEREEREGKER